MLISCVVYTVYMLMADAFRHSMVPSGTMCQIGAVIHGVEKESGLTFCPKRALW